MSGKSSASRTVLLTGFAPFDGDAVNPSWQAARALHGRRIAGHRVTARELPVAFGDSLKALRAAILETRPAVVVCVGLAASRRAISLERIAVNLDDARIPDNAGRKPIDVPVVRAGPAAYFSTLPVKAIRAAIEATGMPAEVSQSAGTYVCNHVFYGLMHALRRRPRVRAGFVHVPPAVAAGAAGSEGLPLAAIVDALRITIATTLSTGEDVRVSAGAID